MPHVRISDSLYKKLQEIMRRTGWKSIGYALDKLTENVNAEDFFSFESEVIIKISKGDD